VLNGEVTGTDQRQTVRVQITAVWLLALAATVSVLAGCGSSSPAKVGGTLQAVAALNPNVNQRPSPLRIVLYELKSVAVFNKADFMALYQADQATLGGEFVAREELTLQPGETRAYARTLAPETRFLGVLAVYRDLERATWRTFVAVQPGKEHALTLRADRLAISATLQP
jgi:type VI secretion system protein VasD